MSDLNINVFNYLSISDFFEDYILIRKKSDLGFSYKTWALELNITSKSYLRLVVTGRRSVTPTFLSKFIQRHHFTSDEMDFLNALADLSRAKTLGQRKAINQLLVQIARRSSHQKNDRTIAVDKDFLTDLTLPRLFVYLTFTDVPKTTQEIAVSWKLDIKETELKLQKLSSLGLIKYESERWMTTQNSFHVPDQQDNSWLKAFHQNSLNEAIDVLKTPQLNRRFRSLLFSLDNEQYQEFVDFTENFLKDLEFKFSSSQYSGKKLMQLSLQAYPVHSSVATEVSKLEFEELTEAQ